jgi:competence ComEA-like helix-hairpin-helix protein
MIERLRDLETSAMLKHIGIWSESDPDRIAEFRAEQRSEDQELKELQSQVKKSNLQHGSLDLNTASKEELMSINGIGTILAERIIARRPYKTIDGLIKVKGIGPKKLEKIRPYVVVGKK